MAERMTAAAASALTVREETSDETALLVSMPIAATPAISDDELQRMLEGAARFPEMHTLGKN